MVYVYVIKNREVCGIFEFIINSLSLFTLYIPFRIYRSDIFKIFCSPFCVYGVVLFSSFPSTFQLIIFFFMSILNCVIFSYFILNVILLKTVKPFKITVLIITIILIFLSRYGVHGVHPQLKHVKQSNR